MPFLDSDPELNGTDFENFSQDDRVISFNSHLNTSSPSTFPIADRVQTSVIWIPLVLIGVSIFICSLIHFIAYFIKVIIKFNYEKKI